MNKHYLYYTALVATLFSVVAFGQSSVESTFSENRNALRDQVWGFTPKMGLMNFSDSRDTNMSRGAVGLTLDWNMNSALDEEIHPIYLGLSTGFLYSHLGNTTSDFFGGAGDSNANSGANAVMIPANIKAGYQANDSLRISALFGGNVIYRSIANSMTLGDNSDNADSNWKIYPNVGLSLEQKVGEQVSINLHPDLTIAPTKNLFVATIGATFFGD